MYYHLNDFKQHGRMCTETLFVSAPVLSRMFLSWANMSKTQRYIFCYQLVQIFTLGKHALFSPILKAFDSWSLIQDTEGAPGFSSTTLNVDLGREVENQLRNIIKAMEQIVRQINIKTIMLKEMVAIDSRKGEYFFENGSGDKRAVTKLKALFMCFLSLFDIKWLISILQPDLLELSCD